MGTKRVVLTPNQLANGPRNCRRCNCEIKAGVPIVAKTSRRPMKRYCMECAERLGL